MKNAVVVALVLLSTTLAFAQAAPERIGYQGRLLKADGTPESASVSLTFKLFNAATGGSALWTETQSVQPVDGFYSVMLGSSTAFGASAFDGSDRYLELSVNGTPLTPRQQVAFVPYALRAKNVSGGSVDATSIAVNGTTVVDSTGKLTGSAVKVGSSGGLVFDSANGLTLTQTCANNEVLRYDSTAKTWSCAPMASSTLTAMAPLTATTAGTTTSISLPKADATTDGYLSKVDYAAFAKKPDTTGSNLIDWTDDATRWTNLFGTGTVTSDAAESLDGTNAFKFEVTTGTTGLAYTYGPLIPVDPTRTYFGTVAARLATGAGPFYAGVIAYDRSGAPLPGNSTYVDMTAQKITSFLAENLFLTATMARFNGRLKGEGTGRTNFPVGTRFVRPVVVTNYKNIGSTMVAAFTFRDGQLTEDTVWQSMHAAAVGSCMAIYRVQGCCGHSVLANDGSTSCNTRCANFASAAGRAGGCAGEVAVQANLGQATLAGQVIGSYYNYSCTGAGGNSRNEVTAVDPGAGYFSYCCCYLQ